MLFTLENINFILVVVVVVLFSVQMNIAYTLNLAINYAIGNFMQ